MTEPAKPTVNPAAVACVVALCLATLALVFMLPLDSLVVDLVYQGF
jgi:hypothetical protein